MPNKQGRYTKEEVICSGLPYFIPRSGRWTSMPYDYAILLSPSRCARFKVPIGKEELPSAFLFCALAGSGTDDQTHRYVPLYDRTEQLRNNNTIRLFPREIMRGQRRRVDELS